MGKLIDITGVRFGRLKVLSFAYKGNNYNSFWNCKCDCGGNVVVNGKHLREGGTKSCGCLQKEKAKATNTKHGLRQSRLYRIWRNILNRCMLATNARYGDYGGRGIKVCAEWRQFESFYKWAIKNGYNDNLTIDRIDNNGNYEPNNCRWATLDAQANNKRNNKIIEICGVKNTFAGWCKVYGINDYVVRNRLKYGWNITDAFRTPVRRKKGA